MSDLAKNNYLLHLFASTIFLSAFNCQNNCVLAQITPDNTLVVPTSSIIKLTEVPLDAEAIFKNNLCKFEDGKIAEGSSFIITGRGGLTPTAEDPLDNVDNVVRWANRENIKVSQNGDVEVRQRSQNKKSATNPTVQQAKGWVTTADGSVWLVANSPKSMAQHSPLVHPDCRL